MPITSQHRENYFLVPLETISPKYNWLLDRIEGTKKGGTASIPNG